jgi:hypothetical protein
MLEEFWDRLGFYHLRAISPFGYPDSHEISMDTGIRGEHCDAGISESVTSPEIAERIVRVADTWIRSCQTDSAKHENCHFSLPTEMPTRLLDVGWGETAPVRLVYCGGKITRYMTLSHCWGDGQDKFTTTIATLPARILGIDLKDLPKTFCEAILFTRAIGVKYLWIDSLCILQDDLLDWEAESSKMSSIFANSYLNIAATSSADAHGGLFHTGYTRRCIDDEEIEEPIGSTEINAGTGPQNKVVFDTHSDFDCIAVERKVIRSPPLLCRAWVLQERILSLRTLDFHADELFWECDTHLTCECGRLVGLEDPRTLNYSNS